MQNVLHVDRDFNTLMGRYGFDTLGFMVFKNKVDKRC